MVWLLSGAIFCLLVNEGWKAIDILEYFGLYIYFEHPSNQKIPVHVFPSEWRRF